MANARSNRQMLELSCYPVAVNNGWLQRTDAAERVLTALRFFEHSPQGPEPDVTGYKGFYYHFLETKNGRRAGTCEISTVDSAFLLAGFLTVTAFFAADAPAEREIRDIADASIAVPTGNGRCLVFPAMPMAGPPRPSKTSPSSTAARRKTGSSAIATRGTMNSS